MKKKLIGRVSFSIEGPATIEKEDGWYVSTFIPLDISSQGRTIKEARDRLAEAVVSYIDSLYRKGTLEDILIERGFRNIGHQKEMRQSFASLEKKDNIIREWDMTVPIPVMVGMASGRLANI